MISITKDELMQRARECGLEFCEEESAQSVFVSLAKMVNTILEHAAARCDSKERLLSNVDCEGAHDRVIAAINSKNC